VSHQLAPKKVGLSGNTAPADLNTVRTGRNLDNSAGPAGKQLNAKEKKDFGKYFLIAAIVAGAGAIIQFILIPALGSSGQRSAKNKRAQAAEELVRYQEILFEYKFEKTREEYIRDQQVIREREKNFNPETAVIGGDWQKASQIVNPSENYAEERAKIEDEKEDPRSLEEIKASVAALRNKQKS